MKKRTLLINSRDAYTFLRICRALDRNIHSLERLSNAGKFPKSIVMQMNILVYDFCEESIASIEGIVANFTQLKNPARLRLYIKSVQNNNTGKPFIYKTYTNNTSDIIKIAISMERIEGILHALEKIHAIDSKKTQNYRHCTAAIKSQANNLLLATQKILSNIGE